MRASFVLSIVTSSDPQTVYLALDDFGRLDRAHRGISKQPLAI
jgi:hypothetical protein